jgi:glycosyltransferase involved in cell wall biosynthesis
MMVQLMTLCCIEGFSRYLYINFQRNRGKGAALLEGMRYAAREGYNHAITIDSDGQHITQEYKF